VTSLFGRNPVAVAVIGAILLGAGLVIHARLLPWVGGGLVAVGGLRALIGLAQRGGGSR
jgi:membrane protein implicated in regulation of membrane protease activity